MDIKIKQNLGFGYVQVETTDAALRSLRIKNSDIYNRIIHKHADTNVLNTPSHIESSLKNRYKFKPQKRPKHVCQIFTVRNKMTGKIAIYYQNMFSKTEKYFEQMMINLLGKQNLVIKTDIGRRNVLKNIQAHIVDLVK